MSDAKRNYEWTEGEFNRAGDGMGTVELYPTKDCEASLLVLPLNQLYQDGNFYHDEYARLNMNDRMLYMQDVMRRQNVHLKLHEVEELIEMLQSYVAWRKEK